MGIYLLNQTLYPIYLMLLSKSFLRFSLPIIFIMTFIASLFWYGNQKQEGLQISASPVEIEWKLISNFEPDNKLRAQLTFVNSGEGQIPADGWALYFNSIRILDPGSFPDDYKVSHIGGYFFKLEPSETFQPIEPGERRDIEYLARFFAIKKSDAPKGFYFVNADDSIETVESVLVHPFETEEQIHRSPGDNIPVPTPEFTYRKNERLGKMGRHDLSPITPAPKMIEFADDYFEFSDEILVYHDPEFSHEARFLADILTEFYGIEAEVTDNRNGERRPDIQLARPGNEFNSAEAYRLDVSSSAIVIASDEPAGAFYGVQSLRSLISNQPGEAKRIQAVSIEDEPAFPYRGMHLDVSRNFHQVDAVKRLLDIMSIYKLNKFHFHLTDDEGWRLAFDALPELTEIGGRRGHTETEDEFMIPVYGSGPDPTPGASMGSGWYTRDEYIDILKFAAERHIEVIPEIDVPGHARAAIIAMERRAERLMEAGDSEGANQYRLHEPEDESVYRSVQNYTDNVINVCLESTYQFMSLVIDDLVDMHHEAEAPLTMIHMGGDEVPRGAWEKSPACNDLMHEKGIENARNLQGYFFNRLAGKLDTYGLKMGGWEEVALSEDDEGVSGINPDFIKSTVPYAWSNVWGSGTEGRAYKLANEGYKVVMSHASNFYFDFAYEKHWQEPGFYWGAMFDTEAPFSFMPFNLFRNAEKDSYGNPLAEDYFDGMVSLNADARENILGLQGQLWSETVNRPERLEYMIFPRLLGLAERAWEGEPEWSEISNRDEMDEKRILAWNEFANRLGQLELPRLDRYFGDIQYRIPPPGAIIIDGKLHANISLPGFTIRYDLDGNEPTADSPLYDGPTELNGGNIVRIAAFSTTGRSGRPVLVQME